jgi:hypothetical protein
MHLVHALRLRRASVGIMYETALRGEGSRERHELETERGGPFTADAVNLPQFAFLVGRGLIDCTDPQVDRSALHGALSPLSVGEDTCSRKS